MSSFFISLYKDSKERLKEINDFQIYKNCGKVSLEKVRSLKSSVIFLFNLSKGLHKEALFYKEKFELLEKEHNELLERLEKTEEKTFITATKVEVK